MNINPSSFDPLQALQEPGPSIPPDPAYTDIIAQQPIKRRRNHDEMTDHNDAEPKRKKTKRKQEILPHDDGRNTTTNVAPKKGRSKASNSPKMDEETLFPCPFYHNDRFNRKYRTKAWQTCAGPGWNISRLKLAQPLSTYTSTLDLWLTKIPESILLNASTNHLATDAPAVLKNSAPCLTSIATFVPTLRAPRMITTAISARSTRSRKPRYGRRRGAAPTSRNGKRSTGSSSN